MPLIDYTSGEKKIGSYYARYDTHFEHRRTEKLKFLEIGVQGGGSLIMWRKYFPNAEIIGIDIDPHCKELATEDIAVHIGDQCDESFLKQFEGCDIVIDDGGHTMRQQQISFNTLFPLMKSGGIYVIEDLHTSYWPKFQDGEITTQQFIGELIDNLNVAAINSERSGGNGKQQKYDISEIHCYESMCFIYKK